MSSTSSSDYDCSAGFCYDSGFKKTVDDPIYPCVGRYPVVYYAHIPQGRCTNRDRISKKDNPNCFIKAFRWYTQELQSPRAISRADDVNVSGFANWLDKKYKEFLHESEREQDYLQFRSKQRSDVKNNCIVNSMEFKPRKTKKFSRMRSPWKKKRRFAKKERDSFCEKHSFKFILRPQDLSRPASECCLKYSQSCCNRSDATFITSRNASPAKKVMKSHSTVCVTKTGNMFETQVNVVTYNVDNDCEIGQTNKEGTAMLEDTKLMNAKPVSEEPIKLKDLNVSCDCLEVDALLKKKDFKTKTPVLTNDGSYQLGADRTISPLKAHVAKETKFVGANITTDAPNKDQHEIKMNCCQCSQHNIEIKDARGRRYETEQEVSKKVTCIQENCKAPCCPTRTTQAQQFHQRQLLDVPSKNMTALKDTNNEAPAIIKDLNVHSVQTSDHSIVIEQDDMSGFPLYMKIFCGNRLCQEST